MKISVRSAKIFANIFSAFLECSVSPTYFSNSFRTFFLARVHHLWVLILLFLLALRIFLIIFLAVLKYKFRFLGNVSTVLGNVLIPDAKFISPLAGAPAAAQ